MPDLGMWLTSINSSKVDLIEEAEDKEAAEKDYNSFIINRLLAYHADAILYVNELNQRPHIDKKLQYRYLLYSLRNRKRYGKWQKPDRSEDLEIVKQYFNYSEPKAIAALNILSQTQIALMKESLFVGGKIKKK
jgi:clamp loader A subunit